MSSCSEEVRSAIRGTRSSDVGVAFEAHFTEEIEDFEYHAIGVCERWRSADRVIARDRDTALVSTLLFLSLRELLISQRFLLLGYERPSGNCLRTACEALGTAIYMVHADVEQKQHYYDKTFAVNKIIQKLRKLSRRAQLPKSRIDELEAVIKFSDKQSHATIMGLADTLRFDCAREEFHLDGFFDGGRIRAYRTELLMRLSVLRSLRSAIDYCQHCLGEPKEKRQSER